MPLTFSRDEFDLILIILKQIHFIYDMIVSNLHL
jgi:hypothetical protein